MSALELRLPPSTSEQLRLFQIFRSLAPVPASDIFSLLRIASALVRFSLLDVFSSPQISSDMSPIASHCFARPGSGRMTPERNLGRDSKAEQHGCPTALHISVHLFRLKARSQPHTAVELVNTNDHRQECTWLCCSTREEPLSAHSQQIHEYIFDSDGASDGHSGLAIREGCLRREPPSPRSPRAVPARTC